MVKKKFLLLCLWIVTALLHLEINILFIHNDVTSEEIFDILKLLKDIIQKCA